MARTRHKKWLVCLLSVMIVLAMMPATAFAAPEDNFSAGGQQFADLQSAVSAAAAAGGVVTVLQDVSVDTATTVENATVTIDLNGKTVTLSETVTIGENANITIQDSTAGAGKITGAKNPLLKIQKGGQLTLESGTLESTGTIGTTVSMNPGSEFLMNGGKLLNSGSGKYNLQVNGGTATITGGRIEGGNNAVYAKSGSAFVTIGNKPAGAQQTQEEAERVYVSALYIGSNTSNVVLNSGTVGKLTSGSFAKGATINCWFKEEIAA